MIRADQIPPEVGEAAMDAVKNGVHDPKTVVAAAINAWPGVERNFWADDGAQVIILPLPTEKSE